MVEANNKWRVFCTGLLVSITGLSALTVVRKEFISLANQTVTWTNRGMFTKDLSPLVADFDQLKQKCPQLSGPTVSALHTDDLELAGLNLMDFNRPAGDQVFRFNMPRYSQPDSRGSLPQYVVYDSAHRCYVIHDVNKIEGRYQIINTTYVGPKGVSSMPDSEQIGQFIRPSCEGFKRGEKQMVLILVLDPGLRFYRINLLNKTITPGPPLTRNIVNAYDLNRGYGLGLHVTSMKNWEEGGPSFLEEIIDAQIETPSMALSRWHWVAALDSSGVVFRLNLDTLTLEDRLGYIGNGPSCKTDQLLAWRSFYVSERNEYKGMVTACLDDRNRITLLAFDDRGNQLGETISWKLDRFYDQQFSSMYCSWVAVFCEYLMPPVLFQLNAFWNSDSDPQTALSSIFLMPDSILKWMAVAECGNNAGEYFWLIQLFYLLAFLMNIMLGVWIGMHARRSGRIKNSPVVWFVAQLLLGPIVFITYRLTRPRIPNVTCENCGRTRPVHLDYCPHCQAVWHPAELQTPQWRMVAD